MNKLPDNFKEIRESHEDYIKLLQQKGIVLSDEIQERLIDLQIIPFKGVYFLEDMLNILYPLIPYSGMFLNMIYMPNGQASIIFDDGSAESRVPPKRAEAYGFVNAAGKFLIECIERGFVKTNWQDMVRKGFETPEYDIRANLLLERNWISQVFSKMTKK